MPLSHAQHWGVVQNTGFDEDPLSPQSALAVAKARRKIWICAPLPRAQHLLSHCPLSACLAPQLAELPNHRVSLRQLPGAKWTATALACSSRDAGRAEADKRFVQA